jgi:hypothetical protein
MGDLVQFAASRAWNVLPLEDLLLGDDARMREAVMERLARHAFDPFGGGPNLQVAEDLLLALEGPVEPALDRAWASFRQSILAAGRSGILVDLARDARPGEASKAI